MSVLQTGLNCERTVSTMSNIKNQKSGLVEGDIDGFYTRLTRDLEGIKCSKESVETHITGRKVYEDGYVQTMGNVPSYNIEQHSTRLSHRLPYGPEVPACIR